MNAFHDNQAQIIDSLRMKDMLGDVSDKRGKIARMIDSGELIRLRRGVYATRRDLNPLCFAASIYGPSYISFETALSYYGLIPEAVYEVISATLKRPKEFENVDIKAAAEEVRPFLRDPRELELWSEQFFVELATKGFPAN